MAKGFTVIAIIVIYCLANSFCKQPVPVPNVLCTNANGNCSSYLDDDGDSSSNSRVLSRKKRHLTFPEASSLQLVYDQTIPIVAAQLLFTVGVTCALAFELPSEPIYHITQQLRDNLLGKKDDDETTTTPPAPAVNATDDDDEHHNSRIDYNHKYLNYINRNQNQQQQQNYYDSMNKHNYYYATNYNDGNKHFHKPLSPNYYISDKSDNYLNNYIPNKADELTNQQYQSSIFVTTPSPAFNQTKNVWTSVINSFVNKYGQKMIQKKLKKPNGKYPNKKKLGNIFLRKHNRVFPVFGKRSVDDHLTNEDKFYMEHHRSTRFDMYEKIEGFLKGKGKNGKACVLRALCETGQKNQSDEKGPFLLEILRAIFSLPHQVEPHKKDTHESFDVAHSTLAEGNCAELYSQCKDSIWSQDFRF